MAVTANQVIKRRAAGSRLGIPVDASVTIYEGTIVFLERTSGSSEGYATSTPDTNANDFAGIAVEKADNSSGSAGDVDCEVWQEGDFLLTGTGFEQKYVGDLAYASDNFTVTPTNSYTLIGRFVEYVSATQMWVRIHTRLA